MPTKSNEKKLTRTEQIKHLTGVFSRLAFGFGEAIAELMRRGMTIEEVFEFVDEINSKYEREMEGRKNVS